MQDVKIQRVQASKLKFAPYNPRRRSFVQRAVVLCEELGKSYYIKEDLRNTLIGSGNYRRTAHREGHQKGGLLCFGMRFYG